MADAQRMKCCKRCLEIKPITHFYKAGKSYQSRCKPCHNIFRKENRQKYKLNHPLQTKQRGNGFKELPEETRAEILKYLGTMPLTKLAIKFDLNCNTLRSWKQRGHLK